MVKKFALSIIIFLLIVPLAHAAPSKLISKMINTPASVFDIFLFQLYNQAKCIEGQYFEDRGNPRSPLCMYSIYYDFDDNIIEMNFLVSSKSTKMAGFKYATDNRKEKMVREVLDYIAILVGVEKRPKDLSDSEFKMIQTTLIHFGWATKDFDEDEVRKEIARRTRISLSVSDAYPFAIEISRDHQVKIFYEKRREYY